MSVKKGLGKGFDSLVPQGASVDIVTTPQQDKIHHLAIDVVKPKTNQPRQNFDEQLLRQLAQSIKEQGILQPIVVTQNEHNNYSIIAGERRWRAARQAGLDVIPAIIKKVDELEHLELSLLENVQRSDLNAIETAVSINRLHQDFQQSYEDIAIRLGKAYTTVVNSTRLLNLPQEMQDAIVKGTISEGHGRALLALIKYPEAQLQLFKDIKSKRLSVRQAEQIVIKIKNSNNLDKKTTVIKVNQPEVAKQLTERFGVPVKVSRSDKKGSITISYKTKEEYQKILRQIQE